jgi:hypothetical protein
MWLSNYFFSDNILGTTIVAWTSVKAYLTVIFCICLILFVDGIVIHIDFNRGGYSSKMRRVVHEHMEESKTYYDDLSLKISDGLSVMPGNKS